MPVVGVDITAREPYDTGLLNATSSAATYSSAACATAAYERIDGTLTIAVDPNDVANETITDLRFAPTDTEGRVQFAADFCLLQNSKACGFLRSAMSGKSA